MEGSDPARFAILPRGSRARRLGITLSPGCPLPQARDEANRPAEAVSDEERERLGILPNGRGGLEHDYLGFDSLPDQTYTVVVGNLPIRSSSPR